MLDTVGQTLGGLFGLKRSNLAVPILDGVFKPNNLLEEAEIVKECAGMEDMAVDADGRLHIACGNLVMVLKDDGQTEEVECYDTVITALAFLGDGRRVVALGDRLVIEGRAEPVREAAGKPFRAITALSPTGGGQLLVSDASAHNGYDRWKYDLMEKRASGRLVRLDAVSGSSEVLQSGVAWSYGACQRPDGDILLSESWRHRLRHLGGKRASEELPGYPARITPTADGGFWLALFSARMQIVEFVLSETDFRREMMATVDPHYWIGPAFSSGQDFHEPLQSGGVKQMGILKPWAPPRSYGLAVRYDRSGSPLMSIHSRVGGENHGVVTVLERGEEVLALSKGAGRLLRLQSGKIREANSVGSVGE